MSLTGHTTPAVSRRPSVAELVARLDAKSPPPPPPVTHQVTASWVAGSSADNDDSVGVVTDTAPAPSGVVQTDPSQWTATLTINRSGKYKRWDSTQAVDLATINNVLVQPSVRESKDGGCYVPGTLVGQDRKAHAVKEINVLVYDLDGSALTDIESRIDDAGFLAWGHTTHNHLTTTTHLATNHLERWARSRGVGYPLSAADMQRYIDDPANHKTYLRNVRYDPNDRTQTDDGIVQVIHHDPVDKYRLIIPLAQPIVLATLGESTQACIATYKSIYNGVAAALGLDHDKKCEDPSRLYYWASHRPGAADDYVARIYGVESLDAAETVPLLDWTDEARWVRVAKTSKPSTAKASKPRAAKTAKTPKHQHLVTTPDGVTVDLLRLAADFDIESVLRSALDDGGIGADRDRGGFTMSCPNEHQHSQAGGHGCFAANASDEHPSWNLHCSHNGCSGDDKFDRLGALVEAGTVTAADLGLQAVAASSVEDGDDDDDGFTLPEGQGCIVPAEYVESALHQLNQRHAVVNRKGKARFLNFRHDGSAGFDTKEAFFAQLASTRYEYYVEGKRHIGKLANKWFEWEHRRQYNDVGFFPGPLPIPPHVFNTYRGFGVEPARGSWKRLQGHIYRVICRRDPKYFRYTMAWLAQLIQEPHIKVGAALVVQGAEGTGKSKLGEWISKLMGLHAMTLGDGDQVTGSFNAFLETCLFLFMEEGFWAGNKKAESILKDLLSGIDYTYQPKGVDLYRGQNYTRIYIASNEKWVVPAGSGGRRFFVLRASDERAKDIAYFKAIDAEMEAGGLAAMLYDLQRFDYSGVDLRNPPVTPWLLEQRMYSADNKRRWLRDVISEGGFRAAEWVTGVDQWTPLALDKPTDVPKAAVLASAKGFFGTDKRKATQAEVGAWLRDELGGTTFALDGPKKREGKTRVPTDPAP